MSRTRARAVCVVDRRRTGLSWEVSVELVVELGPPPDTLLGEPELDLPRARMSLAELTARLVPQCAWNHSLWVRTRLRLSTRPPTCR